VVFGGGGVDGDDGLVAPVDSTGDFGFGDVVGDLGGFGGDVVREVTGDGVGGDSGADGGLGVVSEADDFGDFTTGGGTAGGPLGDFDSDFLAVLGVGVLLVEFDAGGEVLAVRLDVGESFFVKVGADDDAGGAVDDINDSSDEVFFEGFVVAGAGAVTGFVSRVGALEFDFDLVSVEGGGEFSTGDFDTVGIVEGEAGLDVGF